MNLIYCGDDPQGATGYSIQARNILSELTKDFKIAAFGLNRLDESPHDVFNFGKRPPYKIYRAQLSNNPDDDGYEIFRNVSQQINADVLFLMGDIWSFKGWLAGWLEAMQFRKKFKTMGYFSTEYPLSKEEVYILSLVDYPITHSKWSLGFENGAGYDELKKQVPHLIYIPDSIDETMFHALPHDEKMFNRNVVGIKDDQFMIMANNRNSVRKDMPALITAFARVKKEIPKAHLYLHCSSQDMWMSNGESPDLLSLCKSLGLSVLNTMNTMGQTKVDADVSFPYSFTPHHGYPQETLNQIYNCADLFVSVSVAEGFGVTPVEAMFTGVPVLIPGHTGFSNICDAAGIEPVMSYPEIRPNVAQCNVYPINIDDLVNRIINVYENKDKVAFKLKTDEQSTRARMAFSKTNVMSRHWQPLVEEIKQAVTKPKKKEILFVQHSSAGDVFLTTSTFKGLKERHPGMPLTYMTQIQYQDIVTGHPLVDNIIDYKVSQIHDYEVVYKPHEDKILNGHWGAGNTPLAFLYAKSVGVSFNKPEIDMVQPEFNLPEEYIVVHTTSHEYRSYPNFHVALEGCQLPVVQIGSSTDWVLGNGKFNFIDLRGKLSYRESACVIAHAKGFVGIDSFPAHIAGIYDVPSVITFGSGRASITAPLTNAAHRYIEPDYGYCCPILGACFGTYKNCPEPCGRRHDPATVRRAIRIVMPDIFPNVRAKLEKLLAIA